MIWSAQSGLSPSVSAYPVLVSPVRSASLYTRTGGLRPTNRTDPFFSIPHWADRDYCGALPPPVAGIVRTLNPLQSGERKR